MRTFFALLIAFGLSLPALADDFRKDLMLYWSFNNIETAPEFFREHIHPRGYSGGSLELNGANFHVLLQEKVVLRKRFSINFWFKPQDFRATENILSIVGDRSSRMEFVLDKQTILCRVNGHTVEHYPFMILTNDWALVSLNYDGQAFHLTLFSNQVTSTTHFGVSSFDTQAVKELHIATGSNGFRGFLDEIMIYGIDIQTQQLEQLYSGKLPTEADPVAHREPTHTSLNPTKQPENQLATHQAKTFWAGQTVVDQTRLIAEVVDWPKLKNRPDIKLNGQALIKGQTDPTGLTMLKLETDQSNALSFATPAQAQASEMGIRLMNGTTELQRITVPLNPGVETIFSITYRSPDQPITEVQKSLVAAQRRLVIEVWDDKLADGDYISIYHNDNKLVDYQEISKEKITVALQLDPTKSNLISFVSEDTGRYGNNSAKVRILENGQQIDEFRFTATYRKRAGLLIRLQERK